MKFCLSAITCLLLLQAASGSSLQPTFQADIQPLLQKHCYRCHGPEKMKSGVRVDHLDGSLQDRDIKLWSHIHDLVEEGEMPPEDEEQPSVQEREQLLAWATQALHHAKTRIPENNGSARRLTVSQYRNILRDLLGIGEDLTGVLPPDGVSKDGFLNNGQTLLLSPLMVESYFDIAEQALDIAIVEEETLPEIQHFQMDLGRAINPEPCPDKLILGAFNHLLPNDSFVVTEPGLVKPFAFSHRKIRVHYRFNEGYQGNGTVRGWREYDSIYHSVFACMRGLNGYPLGNPYDVAKAGLLLRPAIPSAEQWGVESTYGPRANFKVSLRELPDHGRFRVTVQAAKYEDGLLMGKGSPAAEASDQAVIVENPAKLQEVHIPEAGIYQVDFAQASPEDFVADVDTSKLGDGLAGAWNFDGTTDSALKRKGLSGKLAGDAQFIKSPFGQALSLDGTGDYFVAPRSPDLDVGEGEFSVAAWIRPAQLRQAGIFCLGKYAWKHGWYFDMPNGKGVLRIETVDPENRSNGTVASKPGVIRRNVWQHVAAVVRRGENGTKLFWNGFEVAQGTVNPRNLDNPNVQLHIGRIQDAQQFKGDIDEVRLYRRALSEAEIQALVEPGRQFVKPPKSDPGNLHLTLGGREFTAKYEQPAFLALRLPAGQHSLQAKYNQPSQTDRLVLTPLDDSNEVAHRFLASEKRSPYLGVHLGLRRDCGSTFSQVEAPQEVSGTQLSEFTFEGTIRNYPSPDVQPENDNYLAGIREIGVRSEYTDGRDRPRLLLRSVKFEGPYYESWPPESHRSIFIESENSRNPPTYAREILLNFGNRAFRRPMEPDELSVAYKIWKATYAETKDFHKSVKDALLTLLTSPQFLFLIEKSASPAQEDLNEPELASKIAAFLWNAAPDGELIKLALAGNLQSSLDAQISRMVADSKFSQFASAFTSQWLELHKFDVVETDRKSFPYLTRDTREHLRQQPVELFTYLLRNNLPARHLIQSDFVMANEVVASYYGLGDKVESGFDFIPVKHNRPGLGGILAQASVMAGLSDGRHSNPVKRGAWLARKIIAEPPEPPPPNVPGIEEIDESLPLAERLRLHRDHKGCAGCHAGIDPWGVPLGQFDAGGLFNPEFSDTRATLPDGKEIKDFQSLQNYLATDRIDSVAFSVLKHLATYGSGRTLAYNELVWLRETGVKLRPDGYRMQDLLRFVIHSDIFLKK